MLRSVIVIGLILLAASICRAQESAAADRAKIYEPLIIDAAIQHRVDPRLLWTVAYLETRFRPREVSPKGALGLMQFMPATAQRYGLRSPFDPGQAIDAAARYLRDLQELFGNRLVLILAAYNAGEGAVEAYRSGKKLTLSNGTIINPKEVKAPIPPYRETITYVMAGVEIFKQLVEAKYFSEQHLARLRTINPLTDEKAIRITVYLEDTPADDVDLQNGSVYAFEEAPPGVKNSHR